MKNAEEQKIYKSETSSDQIIFVIYARLNSKNYLIGITCRLRSYPEIFYFHFQKKIPKNSAQVNTYHTLINVLYQK